MKVSTRTASASLFMKAMKEKSKDEYVKRTQKDYSMSFKLQVVQEGKWNVV